MPLNTLKYTTRKTLGIGNACSDGPSPSKLFSCHLCSSSLIFLSHARVSSTKAGKSWPWGLSVPRNASVTLAWERPCRAGPVWGNCPHTNTDFLQVGVLPQQPSSHFTYASSPLPAPSFNTPCVRHMFRQPWMYRAAGHSLGSPACLAPQLPCVPTSTQTFYSLFLSYFLMLHISE